ERPNPRAVFRVQLARKLRQLAAQNHRRRQQDLPADALLLALRDRLRRWRRGGIRREKYAQARARETCQEPAHHRDSIIEKAIDEPHSTLIGIDRPRLSIQKRLQK